MILYFGNNLSKNSFVNLYSKYLSGIAPIKSASHYKNRILRLFHMIAMFFYYFRKSELVIIEVYSGLAFYYAVIISLLSKLFSINYIPVLHGGNLNKRIDNSSRLSNIIFNYSKKNITPSINIQHYFNSKGFEVDYIPNFIDINTFTFKKRGICTPRLLWVRSFHEIYNPKMAIKVIHALSKEYPDAELCMVGNDMDGILNDCKRLVSKLKIKDKVKFIGALPRSQWIKLTDNYDIFLNTTNIESFGLSVIEAAACGMLIVTTNSGELKFIHEDQKNALLVDANDVHQMVRKINALLNNNQLTEYLSINARKNSELYDWHLIKNKWEKLILN